MSPSPKQPIRGAVIGLALALTLALAAPVAAQDIRGIEVCTAEKQIERRTGCLQANIEFLQQALAKQARDAQDKINALTRDLAAARADIAALKAQVDKFAAALAQTKPKPDAGSGAK